jgi:hypothetical protein
VHGRGIVAPHLLLRFFGEQTELPRMDSDNARNPAGRRRRTRDLDRRVDELDQGNLAAAEARGCSDRRKPPSSRSFQVESLKRRS